MIVPYRRLLILFSEVGGCRSFYFVALSTSPISYEVVDGQQRLSAIFEFLSDEIELFRTTSRTRSTISRSTSMKLKMPRMRN
ncbi:hypothetical protein N183_37915 [Sinorhizobium sp. Sb3]|nr:hypothetical protein N183_37915 [Sinorhizobium sp. Sb3]